MNRRLFSLAAGGAALAFTATAVMAAPFPGPTAPSSPLLRATTSRPSTIPPTVATTIPATVPPTVAATIPATVPPTVAATVPPTHPPTSSTVPVADPINFIGHCGYSHSAPDDPIVKMNMPGMSHMHDFFGNRSTNAASTYESMLAAGSTCIRPGEKAGYWVPAMYQNGVKVDPIRMSIYYFNGMLPNASIKPFPAGLKLVAGSSSATTPQGQEIITWSCEVQTGSADDPMRSLTPPTCLPGHNLKAHVKFPNCWDGVNLDSADHKSHLAYAVRGACPAGYPVAVPKLQLNVVYPIVGDPSGLTLASGSVNSMHGDFFNTWVQSDLERLVNTCIVPNIKCEPRA